MRARALPIAVALLVLATAGAWLPLRSGRAAPAQAAPLLRVGVYENPPKIYTDADGRPAGLFVELLGAIAREEGWRLAYERCDWEDCLQRLQAGQLDLMPDVAYSPERDQRFDFHAVPVTYSWSQLFRHPGIAIGAMPDLAHRRVALLRGSVQARALHDVLGGLQVPWTPVETDSFAAAFEAVRDGHADVAAANNFFGRRTARSYGLLETPVMFNPATLYYAAARGRRAHELARIDHWIARWRNQPQSPYFRAMSRALAPAPITVRPRWLLPTLAGAAGLILALAGFSLMLRWRVRRATAEADKARAQLEQVLDASPVVLFLMHQQGEQLVIDWVSSNCARLYGYDPAQMMQPGWWHSRVHADDLPTLEPALAHLRAHPSLTRDYRLLDGRGATRHLHEELRTLATAPGAPLRVVGTWADLSEAKAHAAELSFVAHHDALTGLPNRLLLQLFLCDAVAAGGELAVLVLDLDRLRGINDTLGHALGDQALRAAARRLQGLLPASGFLARLGGDEFALVLPAGGVPVATLAQEMLEAFARPLLAPMHPMVITASIGIALHPRDGADADTLLRHAELALYEAKRQGPGRQQFYEAALSAGAEQRLAVESGLRLAMAQRQFRLHYQPQLDLRDGTLVGVEALVRWQHPQWGLVGPARFIPVAEEAGLIDEVGLWVLMEACRQLRAWDAAGLHIPAISVNCSVRQLDADRLPAQVAAVLAATGLAAQRLEMEITESTLMRDPERAIAALLALQAQGVRLAIDDFGTGHSSLAYLKRLPVTRLKIDRAFVSGIGNDPNDEQICRTVIELARNLRLQTLAEGVEHAHEAEFLRNEGCDLAQGFHYARPLPPEALAAWLAAHRAEAAV
ncbi:EAL domain-containing protein [Cognatiluteimonas weifangensis]|nr:EAL domain-containing protein [Luteimonas weifangensis]